MQLLLSDEVKHKRLLLPVGGVTELPNVHSTTTLHVEVQP